MNDKNALGDEKPDLDEAPALDEKPEGLGEKTSEDLFREGRNFLCRGESFVRGEKIIVGFRGLNQLSLYCGEDPVFQFNHRLEVRRVFHSGQVYRAQLGNLVRLVRASSGGRIVFDPLPVSIKDEQVLLAELEGWLDELRAASGKMHWKTIGEESAAFEERLQVWLDSLARPVVVASIANLG